MRVAVLGLWHLGSVTAACLAGMGHHVVGLDPNAETIASLQKGKSVISEPGLDDLIASGIANGTLTFTADLAAIADNDLLWITFDTPVDDQDNADVEYVLDQVRRGIAWAKAGTLILISSQIPAGSGGALRAWAAQNYPAKSLDFAYLPENLRLGKAISVFTHPDRIVVGCQTKEARERIHALLSPLNADFVWMSVESAEMTKHAINAFLALSVTFINEIASVCERVGADAAEVARGLKTEERIGPKAYLGPGGAFAGGTLARDVAFLGQLGENVHLSMPLIGSIRASNEAHKAWPARGLERHLGEVRGQIITVLGLTYKPGTDTLRRSSAVQLCEWLVEQGAIVRAYDPIVTSLPEPLASAVILSPTIADALSDSRAAIVATEWPVFREIAPETFFEHMSDPFLLDANGFLRGTMGAHPAITYRSVGKP